MSNLASRGEMQVIDDKLQRVVTIKRDDGYDLSEQEALDWFRNRSPDWTYEGWSRRGYSCIELYFTIITIKEEAIEEILTMEITGKRHQPTTYSGSCPQPI